MSMGVIEVLDCCVICFIKEHASDSGCRDVMWYGVESDAGGRFSQRFGESDGLS